MATTHSRTGRRRHRTIRCALTASVALLLAACGAATEAPQAQTADEPQPTRAPSTAVDASAFPTTSETGAAELFAYDEDAPLDLTDVGTVEEGGREIRDVTYASPRGGEVPAYIAEPTEDPAGVGIIMTPGVPEKRHAYLDPISRFACSGATAIVVEAPWARGEGRVYDEAFRFTPEDRDEQIQLVVDQRRAVDVLQTLGAEQIGYTAISYGAGIGAILAGVEDRIDAFALLSGGPGPVVRFISERGHPLYPLATYPQEQREEWVEAMEPIEPIHFVENATAPLLFVVGRDDEIFSRSDLEPIHEAAGDNAEVRWYDAGHDLNPQAFLEHLEWLAGHLGLEWDRVESCFEGAFS